MSEEFRILIIDDHPVVRDGLGAVIGLEPDMIVEGGAGSEAEAFGLIEKSKPDLAVVDISLPGRNGIELIKDIRKLSPKTKIVVYSMHEVKTYASRAFKAGALGYVMKEQGASRVVEALRQALKGEQFLCPDTPEETQAERGGGVALEPETLPLENLSDRQLEIFELVGAGLNSHEIAAKLSLSPKTANAHKMNIQGKLELGSARELLIAATRWVDRR